jgi:hypothetical protein
MEVSGQLHASLFYPQENIPSCPLYMSPDGPQSQSRFHGKEENLDRNSVNIHQSEKIFGTKVRNSNTHFIYSTGLYKSQSFNECDTVLYLPIKYRSVELIWMTFYTRVFPRSPLLLYAICKTESQVCTREL